MLTPVVVLKISEGEGMASACLAIALEAELVVFRYPQYWLSPDLIRKDEHASEKQQLNTAPGSAKPAERQV
jgi:hypothetical protein